MDLVHCIYCSAATNPAFGAEDLKSLLATSRKNNARCGLTGILLYAHGSFFQVLEGDRDVVETTYAKIAKDQRHDRLTKLILEPITHRDFSDWTMGYPKITTHELNTLPGLNDFFTEQTSFLALSEGRAKALVSAFRDGQWRKRL